MLLVQSSRLPAILTAALIAPGTSSFVVSTTATAAPSPHTVASAHFDAEMTLLSRNELFDNKTRLVRTVQGALSMPAARGANTKSKAPAAPPPTVSASTAALEEHFRKLLAVMR
jgi:hypothetical protein